MSVFDTLNQIGGAVGSVGSILAGYLASKIREVRDYAKDAKKDRERAEKAREAVEGVLDQIRAAADGVRRGLRLELEDRVPEIVSRSLAHLHRPTIPDGVPSLHQIDVRFAELSRRLDELKTDILHERGARHGLQRKLEDESKEEERQWKDLHRTLAEIQTQIAVMKATGRM